MMHNTEQRLDKLAQKMGEFINRHRELQATTERLNAENKKLQTEVEEKNRELEQLNNQSKITKLADKITAGSSEERRVLKNKINEYIREIDKCIGMLNE